MTFQVQFLTKYYCIQFHFNSKDKSRKNLTVFHSYINILTIHVMQF